MLICVFGSREQPVLGSSCLQLSGNRVELQVAERLPVLGPGGSVPAGLTKVFGPVIVASSGFAQVCEKQWTAASVRVSSRHFLEREVGGVVQA